MIDDRHGEVSCYGNLGTVYHSIGKCGKAEEYQKKAFVIANKIGNRQGQDSCYGNLGNVYQSIGEYGKAEEYQKKALAITKEIGDRLGEAICYGNLGNVYQCVGEYGKAERYQQKAFVIRKEIGDRKGEALCYGSLGTVYTALGEYGKAEEHLKKAQKEKLHVMATFSGTLFQSLGIYGKAKEYHEKALAVSREIGDINAENAWYFYLATDVLLEGNAGLQHETFSNLFVSTEKSEKMRSFLKDKEEFRISLLDQHSLCYTLLSALFCLMGIY